VSSRPGPSWLGELRQAAWEQCRRSDLPAETEEIWRYSRIDELNFSRYRLRGAQPASPAGLAALADEVDAVVRAAGSGGSVLVSHNGGPGELSGPQPGLDVVPFGAGPLWAGREPLPNLGGPLPDVFAALNQAFVEVPWRVTVAAGVSVPAPLVVVHWVDGDQTVVLPRLEVDLGPGASLKVVEVVASPRADVLVVPVAELSVSAGAQLDYGHVQMLGEGAWEIANQVSRVARDATLRSMTVALGGEYARVRTGSVLEGPGGDSELLAVYLGDGHQMHDLRTVQHHAAPKTRSNLLFKGAAAGNARSVYSGLIRVEKGAKGTNAFQTNRNLVLSEGAQAHSVPNLEIEDNDVRCSHASAVGPIDESQRFYLESRGVPTAAAELLIVLGFLDDVLDRFPVPGMRPVLRAAVAAKLAAAGLGLPDADLPDAGLPDAGQGLPAGRDGRGGGR
jgi:Fe-S cluster assembly protein SufD